ncbi:phosphatases II [Lenzites betulinus]|nr:phosphatases II [Lenzites betulinus]
MSAAVLDSCASLGPPAISRVVPGSILKHTESPDDRRATSRPNDTEADDPFIAQLGRLASQHHASEYNRMKFGPAGSPLLYTPYSVQMSDHYKELQAHQSRCAEQQAWWLSESYPSRQRTVLPSDPVNPHPVPVLSDVSAEINLHEEITAAISAPLDRPRQPQASWQTSETHPIVISTIIPSELLPIISSHIERCADNCPLVFKLARTYLLDRATLRPVEPPAPIPLPPPVIPPSLTPCPPPRPPSSYSITKTLKLPTFFWVHPSVKRAFLGNAVTPRAGIGKRPRPASFAASSTVPYPELGADLKRPTVARNTSSLSSLKTRKDLSTSIPKSILRDINLALPRPHPAQLSNSTLVRPAGIALPEVPRIPPIGIPSLLGNLQLSSCPGKKVRLEGPVRGRSTVCRDLRSDLRRIKDTGVACLVCLLDDNELQTLGVAWEDYVQFAGELGMDVLRIPIPEGLPPGDPAALDSHLTKLINSYTLRGSAILVHCRGGVGRAGIIACCWMLKLGLCGWLDADILSPSPDDDSRKDIGLQQHPAPVDAQTLRLVERMITVVRRRRSPKAIETYEQVRFLVDYVEFLRARGEPWRPDLAADWFTDWSTRVE